MKILSFLVLTLLSVNAYALQVADGQYNGEYNGIDLNAAQTKFNSLSPKGGGGTPLGAVIVWTQEGNPVDWENWHDCDGTSITGTQLCTEKHICTAPDFKGRFLRQQGGLNGGTVGQTQGDAIRNITGFREKICTWSESAGQNGAFAYSNQAGFLPLAPCWDAACSARARNLKFDASLVVPTTDGANAENRPVSYSVRYLIRVND